MTRLLAMLIHDFISSKWHSLGFYYILFCAILLRCFAFSEFKLSLNTRIIFHVLRIPFKYQQHSHAEFQEILLVTVSQKWKSQKRDL